MSPEQLLQIALDNIDQGILMVNAQGQVVVYNERFKEMFHLSEEFLSSQPDFEVGLKHWIEINGLSKFILQKALNNARSDNCYCFEMKNGDRIIEICHNLLEQGGFVRTFTDITERKTAESELKKFYQVVEYSPASIVITDYEGNIEYVNPKFVQLTGYLFHEVIGKNPRVLKSNDTPSEEYRNLWEKITQGQEWVGEFHNVKKNGETYWERALISPIIDDTGKITHFIAVKEDITIQKRIQEELHLLSISDALTGIYNRRKILDVGQCQWAECYRCNHDFSVCMIDIDRFKQINDRFGHNVGDHVLKTIAQSCKKILPQKYTIGRLGGEEFLVILPGCDLSQAIHWAEIIRQEIESLPKIDSEIFFPVTASIGVAVRLGCEDLEGLIAQADRALYQAKDAGRNCVKF